MSGNKKIYDLKTMDTEDLIHLLNQESVKWGFDIKYGDTMSGIIGSKAEMMKDRSGKPKTNAKGTPWWRVEVLRRNAKDELKPIKVKIAADENPFEKHEEGTKVLIKNPVYHRGYFPDDHGGYIKWENITADAIKKA